VLTLFWIEDSVLVMPVRVDWMPPTLFVRLVSEDEIPLTVVVSALTEEVRPVTAVLMDPTWVLRLLTLPERADTAPFTELIPLFTPANPLVTFLPRLVT